MQDDVTRCPRCEKGTLRVRTHTHTTVLAGKTVTDGTAAAQTCDACGYALIGARQMNRYELRAAALVLRDGRFVNGDVVRFARKALGKTQAELGAMIGMTPETVSRWENGQRDVGKSEQLAIVALLDAAERGELDLSRPEGDAPLEVLPSHRAA